jgi:hypothetical protein
MPFQLHRNEHRGKIRNIGGKFAQYLIILALLAGKTVI